MHFLKYKVHTGQVLYASKQSRIWSVHLTRGRVSSQNAMMNVFIGMFISLLSVCGLADSWEAPAGFKQRPVWPEGSSVLAAGVKKLEDKQILSRDPITDVSKPTYTVFRPKRNPSGTALIVFPGGGYLTLAMKVEGTDVCDWLTNVGVTCVLLKYRVPYSGCYWDSKRKRHVTPEVPMALQDAQRTISIIRHDAEKYEINPNKIGVIGFSAGGNMAALVSTAFKKRSYEPIDEIDLISSRPDFSLLLFPGHMTMEHKNKTPKDVAAKELNTDIVISKDIPPTLLLHAQDDKVDPVYYSEIYARELRKAGVKVKLVKYKTGGHVFVSKTGMDSDRWKEDVLSWLKAAKTL